MTPQVKQILVRVGKIAAVVGAVFGLLWVLTGTITASSRVCASCHTRTVHSAKGSIDVHYKATCVDCHEVDGAFARVIVSMPERLQHFVFAKANDTRAQAYGAEVFSAECKKCHAAGIAGTIHDETRGLKTSHKEPLADGAECMDCHLLVQGQVVARTVGMTECVRCHDGTDVSAACSVCHDGDPTQAVLTSSGEQSYASRLLPVPPCAACHGNQPSCKRCHARGVPSTAPKD